MSELIVWPKHIYATSISGRQLCANGGREWFAYHGLDWSNFVFNGITADKLLATADAFADAVVATAQRMEAEDGGQ